MKRVCQNELLATENYDPPLCSEEQKSPLIIEYYIPPFFCTM
jgi:hypothetical protein